MANTIRTEQELIGLFSDNTTGQISAQDMRDLVVTSFEPMQGGLVFNVKTFGALGDGSTDDTTAIKAAITACVNAGGGTVYFPQGTFIATDLPIETNVVWRGSGRGATIIKQKAGTNADFVTGGPQDGFDDAGQWLFATNGAGDPGGVYNWGLFDLTLDGNWAPSNPGNIEGVVLKTYGYCLTIDNIIIRNGADGNWFTDWNAGTGAQTQDQMESWVSNVKMHDTGGINLMYGGPHDSFVTGITIWNHKSHGMIVGPNASAIHWVQLHTWGTNYLGTNSGACGAILVCGYNKFTDVDFEGGTGATAVMLGGDSGFYNLHMFNGGTTGSRPGMILGQNDTTIYDGFSVPGPRQVGGCVIEGFADHYENSTGAIKYVFTGRNKVSMSCFQTSGVMYSGTPSANDEYEFSITGLTADGTVAVGGGRKIVASSTSALIVTNSAARTAMQIDTFSTVPNISFQNNAKLTVYTSGGSTIGDIINYDGAGGIQLGATNPITLRNRGAAFLGFNGAISVGQSASAQSLSNASTILVTAGSSPTQVNMGSVRVTNTGAVTGVILGGGAGSGQLLIVNNEGTGSVTFDVVGTSRVANGTSCVIASNTAKGFIWNGTSWYPMS